MRAARGIAHAVGREREVATVGGERLGAFVQEAHRAQRRARRAAQEDLGAVARALHRLERALLHDPAEDRAHRRALVARGLDDELRRAVLFLDRLRALVARALVDDVLQRGLGEREDERTVGERVEHVGARRPAIDRLRCHRDVHDARALVRRALAPVDDAGRGVVGELLRRGEEERGADAVVDPDCEVRGRAQRDLELLVARRTISIALARRLRQRVRLEHEERVRSLGLVLHAEEEPVPEPVERDAAAER